MKPYKTRRHQARAIAREVLAGKCSIHRAIRDAMMVGAAEERGRIMEILEQRRRHNAFAEITGVEAVIADVPVLEVLGWKKGAKG